MKKTALEQWICRVEKIPRLDRESLEALQLEKLNCLITKLREKGNYVNLPKKLENLSQLSDLPFTTPEILSQHPGRYLLLSQSEISRVISGATSGTTGPAKRVFYTNRDTAHTVGFFAAGIGEMLQPGEKCMIAFPFTGPFGLGDLIAQAVEELGGIPVKAGFGQDYSELCKLLGAERPQTYIGFPVPLLSLSRMYGRDFPIQRALVSADACPDGVMEELEKALGSRLFPHYGSREMCLGGAVTCPAFQGMHLRENHVLAEIVDEEGNPLPEGEYGELVITTLDMEAMPLLRYRTGDYTRFLPPCPCGGVTRRLDRVSRKEPEGALMEKLDSQLFRVSGLVDYKASMEDGLCIEAYTLTEDTREQLMQQLKGYPGAKVTCEPASMMHRPKYLGKRYVIR